MVKCKLVRICDNYLKVDQRFELNALFLLTSIFKKEVNRFNVIQVYRTRGIN